MRSKKSRIESFIVNPKSIDIGELYGSSDPNTLEWSDGCLAYSTRNFSSAYSGASDSEVYFTSFFHQFEIDQFKKVCILQLERKRSIVAVRDFGWTSGHSLGGKLKHNARR